MRDYAIFFDYNNKTYRLPVNPEQIEVSSTLAIEKYEILKAGQIAIPSNMELKEYSFEAEFPKYSKVAPYYAETAQEFHGSDYYLSFFELIREKLIPVRFIAGQFTDKDNDGIVNSNEINLNKCINSLVLIEELTIIEKAGEEGDKYVNFKLLEYREFRKKTTTITEIKLVQSNKLLAKKKREVATQVVNPKSNGYHVVVSGDSLWTIAKKYYGDGSKNNIIYNANKDKIKNPNVLSIGWKLKIPTESEFSKYSSPLPTMKTEKANKAGAVKEFTPTGLGGMSLILYGPDS